MRASICKPFQSHSKPSISIVTFFLHTSNVKDSSVIAVQVFDQSKFKKRDQGFLGVVNIRLSDVIDLESDGHSALCGIFSLCGHS